MSLLIDMDNILVDMTSTWLEKYNAETGENVKNSEITKYQLDNFVSDTKTLYDILVRDGFFFDLEPMPGAVEYFSRMLDEGFDLVVVTQPPRQSDYAVRDKRNWMSLHFPEFDLSNMIFCHRKDMVMGDLLFDDKPDFLESWSATNPDGIVATLDWKYNRHIPTDFRGSLQDGWKDFYEFISRA